MSSEKPVHVPRDRYPEAMYPQVINAIGGEYGGEEEVHLLDYWRVAIMRIWTILAVLLTAVTATMIYTFNQTPVYRATASIQIDKENPNVLTFKDVYEVETASDDTLRTQFEVLKSRRLARRVIESLKLDKEEELQEDKGLVASMLKSFQEYVSPHQQNTEESDRLRPIIDAYLLRLDVSPVRQARLVNISFDSKDPELATRVINAHAKNFIAQNLQFKVDATQEASDFLERNLDTMKQKLEKAEDTLQQYSQQNQIVFTEEGKNTATEKLRQLQEAYTKAQEDRIQKESYYRLLEKGQSEALPPLIENKLISDLTAKLADLQRQESDLSVSFGPDWPPRQRIIEQISQIRRSIDTEKTRLEMMIRSEYSAAVQRQDLLEGELEKQNVAVNKINDAIIQYNIYKGDADSVKALYDGLQKRLKEASVSAGLTASNIRIVDLAEVPQHAVKPRKALNLILSVVIGMFLGLGVAFFQEYVDNSLKAPEDVMRHLKLPTLGMIPKLDSLFGKKGYGHAPYGYGNVEQLAKPASEVADLSANKHKADLIVHESPSSLMAEAYRSVRTSLLLSSPGRPPRTIVVTSATPSEGKTTTAVNLAISLTQTGSKVVLIDADMRKPRIQNVFSLGGGPGLSAFLAGGSKLKDVIHETQIPGLRVIPCGVTPPNPGELILAGSFRKMLEALTEYFDFVVLDSPPVGNVSDARILSVSADSTILVVKALATSRHHAREAVAHLTTGHAKISGVVLNDVDVRRKSYYSGYSYYRTYYSGYGYGESSRKSAS
jgi:polysaccharide biosynthesis transport protein